MNITGRKYPATAYLHEQGTDASKGLLLREDKKTIGEQGFFWLLISIASNWAGSAGRDDGAKTDKIPLNDRVHWAIDNEEILLSYAQSPKINQGWMKADKPWQFLAACNEWLKASKWASANKKSIYDYESHLECFIDGSNNGSQHLSALTLDEVTAPHVNLVPSELPGDLYKYVADHVWAKFNEEISYTDPYTLKQCDSFIDTITDYKLQIAAAPPKSDLRKELVAQIISYKADKKELINQSAVVYWHRIKDSKHKRKICKRGVMTLPYGGSPYGLGQQVIDDARKHGIEQLNSMEHAWGAYMGKAIYNDCEVSLARPMRLLSVFEEAGNKAGKENRFLSWTAPITNFPVVQHYVEGISKRVYIQYGPPIGERINTGYFINTLQIAICFTETTVPSPKKQASGASPNAIHSLDAAHLTVCVYRCPFNVTTIHDSFGCLLGDMAELYAIVRETFVEIYKSNPLKKLMEDIQGDISKVEIGALDLDLVLESEFCFA